MAQGTTAEINLKRAWGLMEGVEKTLEEFRQRVLNHTASLKEESAPGVGGFLGGIASAYMGASRLRKEKSSLSSDLQLASQELDRAAALNRDATIQIKDYTLGIPGMQAILLNLNGMLEMVWGSTEKAKEHFGQSIEISEYGDPHYMLGILYQSEYKPQEALKHFEKCLELDPDGDLSVSALREANAMRNYKKRFRGSWGIFFLLLPIWGIGIIYFIWKRK